MPRLQVKCLFNVFSSKILKIKNKKIEGFETYGDKQIFLQTFASKASFSPFD